MNLFVQFSINRLFSYALCLSTAGCCVCKGGYQTCGYDYAISINAERVDATQRLDTLTVQVLNDSSGYSNFTKISPTRYANGPSDQSIDLSGLTPKYAYDPSSLLALRTYRFNIFYKSNLVAAIDSIKTGVVLVNDCQQLQCPRVVSFRDNGQTYSDAYGHRIRY